MANKTIEQMVEEVKTKNSFYTRDNNGYCGMHIDGTMPSSKKTAIVYQTGGSNWNRAGFLGGGISYFQGTGVYNGAKDMVVKSHQQWRSGTNYADDCPGNRYYLEQFEDLDDGRYRLGLSNCHGKESLIVDFEKGTITYE